MQKIISLDIGSYSIKAIEIQNHFKSYEISNFYENVIPQIEEISPDTVIPACMGQIFSENNIVADRIITAMPGQYVSSRILTFSFSDPAKIASAVESEIEDYVPFNMDDMIVDSQILGSVGDKTNVLVVMTRKKFVGSFLEHLQSIGVDPKLVDIDSLAFYNLCPHIEMEAGKVYGLVDVGHEKTSICLVRDGILLLFRSINLGGRYITDFLARDLEVGYNEATRVKHRVSCVLPPGDSGKGLKEKDRNIAQRMTIASQAIAKELGRTLYAFKNWEKTPVDKIYLSGGTSKIGNYDKFLASHLDVAVLPNRLENSSLLINPDLKDDLPQMAQGMAIGVRAITSLKRHSNINLRKGEFAYVQDYEAALRLTGAVFKVLAVVLALFAVSYLSKYFIYSRQIKQVQTQYKKEYLASFPEQKRRYRNKTIAFSRLQKDSQRFIQNQIDAKETAIRDIQGANQDSGSLVVLADISKTLPKEIEVDVTEYRYTSQPDGSGVVKIRIEADSFDTIAKFKDSLEGIASLSQIVEKQSSNKPGSTKKMADIEGRYIAVR